PGARCGRLSGEEAAGVSEVFEGSFYFSASEIRSASCSNQESSCRMRWKSSRSSYDTGAPVGRASHSSAGRCQTSILTPELARRSTMRESADFVTRRPQLGQRKQYDPLLSLAHTRTTTSDAFSRTSPQDGQVARMVVIPRPPWPL